MTTFVGVTMIEEKKCSKCGVWKNRMTEFYMNKGFFRPSCKTCFKKQTSLNAKKNRELRMALGQTRTNYDSTYARKYYQQHKAQYEQYNATFKSKHPEYFKKYYRDRRDNPSRDIQ